MEVMKILLGKGGAWLEPNGDRMRYILVCMSITEDLPRIVGLRASRALVICCWQAGSE